MQHTSFGATHLTSLLVLFSFSVNLRARKRSYLESLSPWKKSTLGMNTTMKSYSIFKLSYPSYSSAYKQEYSFVHVIIMIYELVIVCML
jgi:hypothetical protein